ncbi:Protein CBG15935 [Caenorhabditis briggsae]|uniref:Protein CBG15935 n=1 Tax=Caenorhabditis briggsae TaxID=6238 RepID=A8XNF9_CAEBR|nr:Protein CBG15935 [Caenorhabditis briggsae]CAP34390.2 Protein CBG15935 [Caenorhabditis briggsae]
MLRILTITLAFVAIVSGELSKTKEDKTLKDLEDKIVNDIITHKVMVYSKTYCPWSKRLKVILANYEIDDMKIVELDRSNQTEEMQEILKKYSGRTPFLNSSSVESLWVDMTKQRLSRRKESFDQCWRRLTLCSLTEYLYLTTVRELVCACVNLSHRPISRI